MASWFYTMGVTMPFCFTRCYFVLLHFILLYQVCYLRSSTVFLTNQNRFPVFPHITKYFLYRFSHLQDAHHSITVSYEIHNRYHFSNILHIIFYGHLLISAQLIYLLPFCRRMWSLLLSTDKSLGSTRASSVSRI